MVGIIIGLNHCHLGIENLNKLIQIMKNWLNDTKLGCVVGLGAKLMEKNLDVEKKLLEKNEEIFVKFGLFKED